MKPTKDQIKIISKTFNIQHIGHSRIDGSPYFKMRKDIFEIHDMREYFNIEYVPLLEDVGFPNINSFPAGEKDYFMVKINDINESFYKLIRKEKLIKINLSV